MMLSHAAMLSPITFAACIILAERALFVSAIPMKRQVNPAAFSGVTDQISGAGQAAGHKAASATSGLSHTQLALVIAFCIIGLVAVIAATFWLCSCSRRRKRAREQADSTSSLHSSSSTKEMQQELPEHYQQQRHSLLPATDRIHRHGDRVSGWGESRVALNSSFVQSNDNMYAWNERPTDRTTPAPHTQQHRHSHRY